MVAELLTEEIREVRAEVDVIKKSYTDTIEGIIAKHSFSHSGLDAAYTEAKKSSKPLLAILEASYSSLGDYFGENSVAFALMQKSAYYMYNWIISFSRKNGSVYAEATKLDLREHNKLLYYMAVNYRKEMHKAKVNPDGYIIMMPPEVGRAEFKLEKPTISLNFSAKKRFRFGTLRRLGSMRRLKKEKNQWYFPITDVASTLKGYNNSVFEVWDIYTRILYAAQGVIKNIEVIHQ